MHTDAFTCCTVTCLKYMAVHISEKDPPIIWTHLSTAMHQTVTMLCIYVFTFISSDLMSGQLNFIPNIENVIFWFKLYSVSWDYWWDYLNKFISEDLWASLSHASSKPVADAMETWTKQMGYPVLFVTAKQVCVYQYFALDLFSARGFPLITRE